MSGNHHVYFPSPRLPQMLTVFFSLANGVQHLNSLLHAYFFRGKDEIGGQSAG